MNYTNDQKHRFVQEYINGKPVIEICQEFRIPRSTLYYWIHQFSEIKRPNREAVTAQRLCLLEKRIQRLTTELEIWKRCNCTIHSPLPQKLQEIEKLYGEFGVHAPCRVLEVRRSTFYHHIFRRPEQTLIQKEDELLKPVIQSIFDDTKGRLGTKKIRICLIAQGYTASPARISRLMKEMGLVCVSTRKSVKYNFTEKGKYRENSLKQQFEQKSPNCVWAGDITYLYVNYKPYYLCVIIDLFSRKVIAYSLSNSLDTFFVSEAFHAAFNNRGCPANLLFHSDQGLQYTSYDFRMLLKSKRVGQSFSDPGCPYDNAVAESFFRSLKAEEVYHHYYQTVEQLAASIEEYVGFFNSKRPHQKLGYLTPDQAEENYFLA